VPHPSPILVMECFQRLTSKNPRNSFVIYDHNSVKDENKGFRDDLDSEIEIQRSISKSKQSSFGTLPKSEHAYSHMPIGLSVMWALDGKGLAARTC